MEREINDDVRRYDHLCAPGYLAAMVFSNTHTDRDVLKTSEVITGNQLVCPGSCGIDGKHHKKVQTPMPCKRAKVELRARHCPERLLGAPHDSCPTIKICM